MWSNEMPILNEQIYHAPVIYDDYGMFFNTNTSIPLSLIVGFQNLVIYVEFQRDIDVLEYEIMEGDISPDHSNVKNSGMFLPKLNITLPDWGKLNPINNQQY